MQAAFEKVYATNEWQFGSGEGSLRKHTRGYVEFLQQFLKDHQIRSVVDMGCGDWQFSRYLDWTGINYHGYDLVESVISTNQRRFAKPNITFTRYEGDFNVLPNADLLIAKDVLQHLSHANILQFLPTLQRYPKCLITNCVNPHGPTVNKDIQDGEFRYLDLRLPPYSLNAEELYEFTNHQPRWLGGLVKVRWRKKVLLFRNSVNPS
jgi:SAM-dependent methyltransferase